MIPKSGRDARESASNNYEERIADLQYGGGVEVCMGMGKTGIPWDSHGNGSKISHGMGMGWELSAREWELRRGSWRSAEQPCHQQL